MNFQGFEDEQLFLQLLCLTLTTEQKFKLKLALLKLRSQSQDQDINFWGKIEGVTSNYYIASTVKYKGCYQFPHKTFYWTGPDFIFKQMPGLNPCHTDGLISIKSFFTGVPQKIVINIEGQGDEIVDQQPKQPQNGQQVKKQQEQQEDQQKIPPRNLTQIQRLSCTVRAIQNECQVVPIGAYKMNTSHQLQKNLVFKGLTKQRAINIESYQHFRAVQTQNKKMELKKPDTLFKYDFLQSICQDEPRGCWILQSDFSGKKCSVRNLKWPGYFGYNQVDTPIFGGVYIGDGLANTDLPFMI